MAGEDLVVGGFAEKVGVVRGDQIDQGADLVLPRRRPEQPAVVLETPHAERSQPLPEPACDERLTVRAQTNPAAIENKVGDERVGPLRQRRFRGYQHGDRGTAGILHGYTLRHRSLLHPIIARSESGSGGPTNHAAVDQKFRKWRSS